MLKIGICDDEAVIAQTLNQYVREWAETTDQTVQTAVFDSAEQLLFSYAEQKYDILLLDIQMNGMDGVVLSKRVRAADERVQIVFITAIPDFIAEGYEVSALHYLLKPVRREKLFEVLDKAVKKLQVSEPMLVWQIDGEMQVIPLRTIRYAEAKGHYVTVYTDTDAAVRKMTLAQLLDKLDKRFFKCQRSFLVNLHRVKRVTRTQVELLTGEILPLSRGLYDMIHHQMIALYPEEQDV